MKIEQTIQRLSKGIGGRYVAGATRNASAVTLVDTECWFFIHRNRTRCVTMLHRIHHQRVAIPAVPPNITTCGHHLQRQQP